MNKIAGMLSVVFLLFIALPLEAVAQGGDAPPPPCCRWEGMPPGDADATPTVAPPSRFYVSAEGLRRMGFTRSQFVDRLSLALFSGRAADLVLTLTRQIYESSPARDEMRLGGGARAGDNLLIVQEKRVYQVSRSLVSDQELESFDELMITDGLASVEISFLREGTGNAVR